MKRATTLLIIVALVVAVPVGPALAHPPICDWASPALGAGAVVSGAGAFLPALSAAGMTAPALGHQAVSLVRLVVHQIDARYEVCID